MTSATRHRPSRRRTEPAARGYRPRYSAGRADPCHGRVTRDHRALAAADRDAEAEQPAAAIALGAEAVAICREAVGANRDRELSGLATALNQQADRILALPAVSVRQAEEAAALQSEAAALLAERDRS